MPAATPERDDPGPSEPIRSVPRVPDDSAPKAPELSDLELSEAPTRVVRTGSGSVCSSSSGHVGPPPGRAGTSTASTDEAPPGGRERLGRYEVIAEIGRGGVGAVVRAHDAEIGRDVAVKLMLDAHRGDPEMTRRFVEEARIAGQLQHPGVVPVYEMGLVGGDRPFFAMKLVVGRTLADLLDDREDPTEDRQRLFGIFEQVCQTMGYAHARRVIHRDLKPSNVMVGAFGEVQVMDWGLAKVLAADAAEDDPAREPPPAGPEEGATRPDPEAGPPPPRTGSSGSLSVAGSVLGTPSYMSPEQARGLSARIDRRSDVFGLGAILCEILTGKPPYTGFTIDDVFRKAEEASLDDAFARLDECGADPQVVELAKGCLSRVAADRPGDAGCVAERIRRYRESLAVRARSSELRATRARFRLVLLATVLGTLIAAAAGYAVLESGSRRRTARTAEAVNLALTDAMDLLADARVQGLRDLSRWDSALGEAERALALAESLRDRPLVQRASRVRDAIAAEVRDRSMAARLEAIREDAGTVLDQIERGGPRPPTGETFPQEAASSLGEIDRRYREAFVEYGIDVESLSPDDAASRIRSSDIAGRLILALDQWTLLWRVGLRRDPAIREKMFLAAQFSDDDVWLMQVRNAESASDLETLRMLASDPKILGAAPSTLDVLARTFDRLGQLDLEEEVLAEARRAYPGDFWINARLVRLLLDLGRHRDALPYATAAVALRPSSGYARYLAGRTLLGLKDVARGIDELRRDLELSPESPRYYALLSATVGGLAPGRERAAVADLLGTLESLWSSGRPYHVDGLVRLLAQALFFTGERARAIAALEESLRVSAVPRDIFPSPGRRDPTHAHLLEEYRAAVLPDIVSFASIDAALDPPSAAGAQGGGPVDPGGLLSALREATGRSAEQEPEARIRYLEGRIAQRDGRFREAAEMFGVVLSRERERGFPEPHLRLAESLRAAGESGAADAGLREALSMADVEYAALWNLWLAISWVDLGKSPGAVLSLLPVPTPVPTPVSFPVSGPETGRAGRPRRFRLPSGYAADVRWLLDRLEDGEPIRINCGGGDHRGGDGAVWSRDRFFTPGGNEFASGPTRVTAGGDENPLFQTERWFATDPPGPKGYRIPLPPGSYRVTLHFAEIYWPAAEEGSGFRRVFDVLLQGRRRLEGYSPQLRGFATAEAHPFAVEVTDGILDIEFRHVIENPKVSAIEVERMR